MQGPCPGKLFLRDTARADKAISCLPLSETTQGRGSTLQYVYNNSIFYLAIALKYVFFMINFLKWILFELTATAKDIGDIFLSTLRKSACNCNANEIK